LLSSTIYTGQQEIELHMKIWPPFKRILSNLIIIYENLKHCFENVPWASLSQTVLRWLNCLIAWKKELIWAHFELVWLSAHPNHPPAPDGTVSSESNILVPISICAVVVRQGVAVCGMRTGRQVRRVGRTRSFTRTHIADRHFQPPLRRRLVRLIAAQGVRGRNLPARNWPAPPSTASSACQTPRKMNLHWRTHVLLLLCGTLCGLALGKYFYTPATTWNLRRHYTILKKNIDWHFNMQI
jgi:hypothetical protein